MKKLASTKIGGKVVDVCVMTFDEIKAINRHKSNRPCGMDDEYQDEYSTESKRRGRTHRRQLYSSIIKNGFDPTAKVFMVGEYNGNFYMADGQHTLGGIIDYNNTHEDKYNEFIVHVNHYDNEKDFKQGMRLMNYAMKKWDATQFTNLDDEVRLIKRKISRETGLSEKNCDKFLFGDLTTSSYEHKTIKDVKSFWEDKLSYFTQIINSMKDKQRSRELKVIMEKDGFILLNGLMDRLFNYPHIEQNGFKRKNYDEKCQWSHRAMSQLVDFFDNVNFDTYNDLLINNKRINDGQAYKRKEWYRDNFYRLFMKEGKKAFTKDTFDCIRKWAKKDDLSEDYNV